jgi:adenylosuccinate lyase
MDCREARDLLAELTRNQLESHLADAVRAFQEHAVAVALAMRESGAPDNDLLDRLAADARLGLSRDELSALIAEPITFTGAARSQVDAVVGEIAEIVTAHAGAASYVPGAIL